MLRNNLLERVPRLRDLISQGKRNKAAKTFSSDRDALSKLLLCFPAQTRGDLTPPQRGIIDEIEALLRAPVLQSASSLKMQVCDDAKDAIRLGISGPTRLLSDGSIAAAVLSLDLRKSTALMSKARAGRDFAKFITELTNLLSEIIRSDYGVVDKFTGDGILAFFPECLAGPDYVMRAVEAAFRCHDVFETHYRRLRDCFDARPSDAGYGIGIDCGDVELVWMHENLTVVGPSVVYACRLGGAPAGSVYVGQRAVSAIESSEHFSKRIRTDEISDFDFKGEGKHIVTKIKLRKKFRGDKNALELQPPPWLLQYRSAKRSSWVAS